MITGLIIKKVKDKIEKFRKISEQEKMESRTIRQDDIKLYFDDQNRVRLHYKDIELTKHAGFCVRILVEGAWHDSIDSEFEIVKSSCDELRVTQKAHNLPLHQVWNIKITPEGNIVWSVNVELKEPLRIDLVNTKVFLSKSYSQWLMPLKQGAFPPSFTPEWQGMNSFEDKPDFIGLTSSLEEFPSVVLKSVDNPKAALLIQNTNVELSSRALEVQFEEEKEFYQPGTYPFLNAVIRLYPDKAVLGKTVKEIIQKHEEEVRRQQEEELRRHQEEERRKDEERRQQEEMRAREKEERIRIMQEEDRKQRTLKSGDFMLYFDQQNSTHIYYKGNELTKGLGLNTGIFSEGNWRGFLDSRVEIGRSSSDKMIIKLFHNQLPLSQIWHLKFTAQGLFTWDVDLCLNAPLRIDRRNASIFLSKAYKDWVAPPKQGAFPPSFTPEWQGMNSFEDKPDFIGLTSSLEEFPSVVLKSVDNPKAALLIQNTNVELSSRALEVQFEEEKEFYQPGTYTYLRAVIRFYADRADFAGILREIREKQEEERKRQIEERNKWIEERKQQQEETRKQEERRRQEEEKRRTIQKGHSRLYFDPQNHMHVYYKGNELTKGTGVDTGILSEGNWYGLIDSEVRIEKISSEEFSLHLIHNQLPLVQVWHIKIAEDGEIIWNAAIEIKSPLRIDRRNASIFLSKAYKDWVAPPKQGAFPPSFTPEWQGMNSFEDKPDFIGLTSSLEEFPSVVLKSVDNPKAALLIQNTNVELSSRALEVQFEEEKEFYQPGTYPFLNAVIRLYPDKAVLGKTVKEIIQKHEEEVRRQQEEELRRHQEEERRKDEERRRQREIRKKREEERRLKQEARKLVSKLKEGKRGKNKDICIFGDNEDLHDKISSKRGDFKRSLAKIKGAANNKSVRIGVSRFNFFRLNEIAQFCTSLLNQRIDLRSVSLGRFPVKKIYSNFIYYMKELNSRIDSNKIKFFLKDKKLLDILYRVSSQADQYNEKELLRLLGVITEHPFIGPQTIVLDTNHRCNTNCIHCWIHTPKRKLSPKTVNTRMDFSLYKNIVDDAIKLLCDEIIFQGDGEPLLDSRFFEMVRYARDRGLKVLFFTNGILLDKERAKKIIDLEINEIFCSLPAGTDATYAAINSWQSKNTFHKIADNLRGLINLRGSLKRDKPWLQMSHVIHNMNYHELEEMSKIDAYIGADKVRFYLVRLDENIKSLKLNRSHIEAMRESLKKVAPYLKKKNIELQDNIYFQLNNYNPVTGSWSGNTFLKSGCPVGWFFCLALARGELSMCCHLRTLDCLEGKTFQDVWNSENYNKLRVQAKYLMKNKDVTFVNGVKLYDEFCTHCDTHQVILMINELLQKYKLDKFL